MDYLRKGYRAPARWLQTGSDTVTIRWYRAAPEAKVYLLPHAFASTVWDEPEDIASTGPGEVPGIRTFAPSPPTAPEGQSTSTPAAYLAHGVPNALKDTPCFHAAVSACGCGRTEGNTYASLYKAAVSACGCGSDQGHT